MPFLAITPSLCINTLTQPFSPIYIRLVFVWIWCKAVKWVFGMTKQEDWCDKKRERKWLQGVKNNWDGIIAWIIYLPAAPWLRASSRTSLEMDGRTLHLISFFENPYGVGYIRTPVHPGGGWCGPKNCTLKNFTSRSKLSVQSIFKEVLGLLDYRSSGVIEIGKLLLFEAPSCDFVIITNKRR